MKSTHNNIKVVDLDKNYEEQAYDLLNQHEESSLFLLSNLKFYGPKLTSDDYSGNFKCLVKNETVIAIFVLTKNGNLLLQTNRTYDCSKIIIDQCLKDHIPLNGIISDWELANTSWERAKIQLPSLKEKLNKKLIIFQLQLENMERHKCEYDIRYLTHSDYKEWDLLNAACLQELKLELSKDGEARRDKFLRDIKDKHWLGLFVKERMTSIATFMLHVNKTGQIGSVYTLPEMRQQGLAKALISQQLLDGKTNKNMNKVILFTDKNNNTAIKLYKSLGFNYIGHFGFLFGTYLATIKETIKFN